MKRIPVKSSDLASVGYDEHTQTLEVEFQDKSIYQYTSVSKYVYLELMSAKSKGKILSPLHSGQSPLRLYKDIPHNEMA